MPEWIFVSILILVLNFQKKIFLILFLPPLFETFHIWNIGPSCWWSHTNL